ncbi:hypothetical protein BY458DRAFT_485385 [Sporodiniella umbellata]|nr:hypothetical protein BY458DRAFT_485385 [Sporodiniella umbellata]
MLYLVPLFIGAVLASDKSVWSLTSPVPNQTEAPGDPISFTYVVNAIPTDYQQQPLLANAPHYPSSLVVYFQWTSKSTNQPIQLTAAKALPLDPLPGGAGGGTYEHIWKLPGCPFFKRYQPDHWDYSLVFQPVYRNDSASAKASLVTIPLNISLSQPSKVIGRKKHSSQGCQ